MQRGNIFLSYSSLIYLLSHNRMYLWLPQTVSKNREIVIEIPSTENLVIVGLKVCAPFQTNFSPFFSKFVKSLAILEKFRINHL